MKNSESNEIISLVNALSPYKTVEWLKFSPSERLKRSWRLRSQIKNPDIIHDQKLFPKP